MDWLVTMLNRFVLLSPLRVFYSALLTLIVLNPVWADDTEIFFNTAASNGVKPNIVFVLDASDSMPWFDCENGDVEKHFSCDDDSEAGNSTRLSRMNSAVRDVLDAADNINVGVMRFGGVDGGRVVYPVTDINANACPGSVCDENTIFEAQAAVHTPEDDAVERANGDVVTYQKNIALADGTPGHHISAMRFSDLNIPQGATIEEAKIVFTSSHNTGAPANNTIKVEDVADAEPFARNSTFTISGRNWHANTVAWNGINAWVKDSIYQSPDLSSLLQPIVSRSDWCGGNAVSLHIDGAGYRSIYGYEQHNRKGAILRVKFRLAGIPESGGCAVKSTTFALDRAEADSVEVHATGAVDIAGNRLEISNNVMTGVQFSEVLIPQGVNVRKAFIEFDSWESGGGGNLRANISMENTTDSASFEEVNNNLSSRAKLPGLDWAVPLINRNTVPIRTRDLSPLVNTIVADPGWEEGNRMSFFFEKSGGGANDLRKFHTRNQSPKRVALLTISYEIPGRTALEFAGDTRSAIKSELADIRTIIGTPTVGAIEEAHRYFAGLAVNHGKNRHVHNINTIDDDRTRLSHPDSYTGGTQVRPVHCMDSRLSTPECEAEIITGNPVYKSPAEFECQPNYMVLLSDGEPWIGGGNSKPPEWHDTIAYVQERHGGNCDITGLNIPYRCGAELTKHMFENDLSNDVDGKQNVITHAVGFNIKSDWIKDLAEDGGGDYYEAETASELLFALSDIVTNVSEGGSTFVAPAITLDQTSRLSHRDDVYLALFEPAGTDAWHGNLKKYKFDGPVLKDQVPAIAIDKDTGEFLTTARSYWSADVDGSEVTLGGAAHELDPLDRNIVTYAGTESLLTAANRIDTDNTFITPAVFGAADSAELTKLVDWMTGFDVKDADEDESTNDTRHHIGDPLHSTPVLVTYGPGNPDDDNVENDDPESVVFFGTNEGFLHAIDAQNGSEDFAFMPPELLKNVKTLFEDRTINRSGGKPYGMDGDLTLWTIDNNGNGYIESTDGDKAYLYAGMRRGGRNYYALDVSNRADPKFMWSVKGGTGDFGELGQSWSKPTLAKIQIGTNDPQQVLIFAGGYDPSQDDKTVREADQSGRALYFVDALNGSLIWKGGLGTVQPATGHHETFADMNYSFPSDLIAISDNNDLLSQIYVGDMGGRVWRFDINNGLNRSDLVDGGVIADFGKDGSEADARRFYSAPDLSLAQINGEKTINVAIGSGYRAHPLDTVIEDKFFMFRYPYAKRNPATYGLKRADNSYKPITYLDDLYDTTLNLIGEGTEQQVEDAETALAGKQGWYINMDEAGEKILGKSNTLNNVIRFISYSPMLNTEAANICDPNLGGSNYWAINLDDATPVERVDENGDHVSVSREDRKSEVPGGGLAPPVTTVFIEKDGDVVVTDTTGPQVIREWDDIPLLRRWYWAEDPEL